MIPSSLESIDEGSHVSLDRIDRESADKGSPLALERFVVVVDKGRRRVVTSRRSPNPNRKSHCRVSASSSHLMTERQRRSFDKEWFPTSPVGMDDSSSASSIPPPPPPIDTSPGQPRRKESRRYSTFPSPQSPLMTRRQLHAFEYEWFEQPRDKRDRPPVRPLRIRDSEDVRYYENPQSRRFFFGAHESSGSSSDSGGHVAGGRGQVQRCSMNANAA